MITCTFEDGGQGNLRHVTVDCVVVKDGKVLLAKRSKGLLEAGKWGLLGGFLDRDETIEEGGRREVFEESGWQVENLRLLYINDSPDRPAEDRQNVTFIYVADAVEQTGESDHESDEVRWFPLEELPPKDQIAFDHFDALDRYRNSLH